MFSSRFREFKLFTIPALMLITWAVTPVGDAHAQSTERVTQGKALAEELGCAVCHGENGIGVDDRTPNMAGQDKSYLIRQLESLSDPAFDEGKDSESYARYHYGMESSSRTLNYTEMSLLATYYASLSCIPTTVVEPEDIPGEVKNCARCHGRSGVNIKPGVPDLSGQKEEYIKRQLKAFRASRFGTDAISGDEERFHDQMEEKAVPLTDDAIDIIAAYYSSLGCSQESRE